MREMKMKEKIRKIFTTNKLGKCREPACNQITKKTQK